MAPFSTDPTPCVLLVEDDPDMRAMLRATLARCGYGNTVQAANGAEALDVSQGRTLALVICDW
jgi:CheY-like chemotaxis protein